MLTFLGLNNNVFPLRTNTYPVTRGIRVELAATIIVGILGVISQVRLWNVIKERRAREEDIRKEHSRKIEEEDAEAGRRLEEKNIQERAEWELIYGNGKAADVKAASVSETAVGDSRRGSDGFTSSENSKDAEIELKEVPSSGTSGSASDGGQNGTGENGTRELEAVPEESSQLDQPTEGVQDQEPKKQAEPRGHRPATPVTHALGVADDAASENGAIVGSEVGTPRSKRFSGREMVNRISWRDRNGVMLASESQEALVAHDDDANSSVRGVADDLHETSAGCPSVASDVQEPVEVIEKKPDIADEPLQKDTSTEAKSTVGSHVQVPQDAGLGVDTGAPTQQDATKVVSEEPCVGETAPQMTPVKGTVAADSPVEKPPVSEASEPPRSPETPATDVQPEVTAPVKTEQVKAQSTLQPSPLSSEKVASVKDTSESRPRTAVTVKPESVPEPAPIPVPELAPEPVPEPKIEPPKVEPKVEVIRRLDASTVKSLPEQTSRVIHSYRTNEWAKHLGDAETPEWEPIVFDPEPETQDPDEAQEAAAYVDVGGLLQTPLTAQPPPVVNRPEIQEVEAQQPVYISSMPSPEIPQSKTRTGAQGLTTKEIPIPVTQNDSAVAAVPMMRSSSGPTSPTQEQAFTSARKASTPLLTITTPNPPKETEPSPRWSGPPPLLAVREDMVRNRMSSTSNRFDPWSSRNQPRQSLADMSPIVSPISPTSPLSVPEERDEVYETPHDADNIPLSKRRALLQRQTIQSPSSASLHSLEAQSPIPSPVHSPPSPSGDLNGSASRMAAWRQSVREEITQKRDILQSPPISPVIPEKRTTWGSVQQMREASSTQIGNAIADGMQRGSMTDLHRQAMRRMQASANRQL